MCFVSCLVMSKTRKILFAFSRGVYFSRTNYDNGFGQLLEFSLGFVSQISGKGHFDELLGGKTIYEDDLIAFLCDNDNPNLRY